MAGAAVLNDLDIYLAVRRKKTTIYLEAEESTTVAELKNMIEAITKVAPNDQVLFDWKDKPLDEKKNMFANGYDWEFACASCPAEVKVAYRQADGEFEALDVINYSPAPELPDVMKASQQENEDENAAAHGQ